MLARVNPGSFRGGFSLEQRVHGVSIVKQSVDGTLAPVDTHVFQEFAALPMEFDQEIER